MTDAWKEYTFKVTPNQNAAGLITIDLGAQTGIYKVDDLSVADPLLGTGVVSEDQSGLPRGLTLEQNYPNPFNPSTTIAFTVAVTGPTRLDVFDLLGRHAATLFDRTAEAGVRTEVPFDASGLPSGMYVSVLRSGAGTATRSLVLVK